MNTSDFLPFLLGDLPGAPDALVKQNLVLAAMEFCIETLAWQEIQDPIIVIDKINEIDIDVPTDARIVTIKDVWGPSRRLVPVTMSQLFEKIPNWQTAQGSEPTYYNASADWKTLKVFPIPLEANRQALRVRVAYAPTVSAKTLPDEIATKYMDGLMAGAKARMQMMPGKTWSDNTSAGINRTIFQDAMLKAKIDILHDRVQGSLSVRPVSFA